MANIPPMVPGSLPTPEELEFKRKNLPEKPGCYIYKDDQGKVLYVGKAKNLKRRVNSYWMDHKSQDPLYTQKIKKLVSLIRDFEIFVVENEAEAFLLENELIKKYMPHFNAMLKDDKSYPWVIITNEKFPRIFIIRGPERYGLHNKFIGPFVDSFDLKRTLRTVRKIFPYCTCKSCAQQQARTRPCTFYQIKLCPGPCTGNISREDYLENIKGIEQLLTGETDPIRAIFQAKMEDAAKSLDFEHAALYRDRLQALDNLIFSQSVIDLGAPNGEPQTFTENNIPTESVLPRNAFDNLKNLDIIAGHFTSRRAGIVIIHVNKGKLIGKTPYIVELDEKIAEEDEYFASFIQQHYLRSDIPLPDEIITEIPLSDEITTALHQAFDTQKLSTQSHDVKFRVPHESDKSAGLMRIAKKNIELLIKQKEEYESYLKEQKLDEKDLETITQGLLQLKEALDLDDVPNIIECFDISNIQGTDPVGSMVTFVEGKPSKAHYRKFKVRSKSTPDDFAMMQEVLGRRYQRAINEHQTMPDLIVIDGGKGQLHVADQVLTDLGIQDLPHIGLAKREEEIFKPGESEPILLSKDSPGLHILQAIRDEAHRFAITYHKLLRQKRQTKSELDEIDGVGPARKQKLLQFFGDISEIRNASQDSLADVIGSSIAKIVHNYFETHPINTNTSDKIKQQLETMQVKDAKRVKKTTRKQVFKEE